MLLITSMAILKSMCKSQMQRWKKSKSKMNQPVKIVRNAVRPMVYKLGRYGKFMACSDFPDCRNTKAIIKPIGVTCPTCKEGQVVERKSKTKRIFYGCDRYPECEYVSWDKPIARPCPKCESTLVEKKLKKGVQIQCTECDYKEDTQ